MVFNDSYILAVETSSRTGSVAAGRGGTILGELEFTAGARHGVELIPAVDRLVREANLKPDQFEIICVSAGPGSFTGLRVGFTFARSLAQISGAKLVQVPSTEVIVANLHDQLAAEPGPVFVAPIMDAKRGQVYTAGFRWHAGGLEKVLNETAITPAQLLGQLGRPAWITGEGIDYHRQAFANHPDVVLTDQTLWRPRAKNVLTLGLEKAHRNEFTELNHLLPTYVRLPEAEERWQKRQENASQTNP